MQLIGIDYAQIQKCLEFKKVAITNLIKAMLMRHGFLQKIHSFTDLSNLNLKQEDKAIESVYSCGEIDQLFKKDGLH